MRAVDANRLNKLFRKAGSVLGIKLDSLAVVSERRMLFKLWGIMDNDSPSAGCASHTQEHLQQQTVTITVHNRTP